MRSMNFRLFTKVYLLFCVQVIAIDYTFLKDTVLKRQKRVLDDDYINLNQQKPLELAKDNFLLSKPTTNDEVFKALLRTPKVSLDDIKEQRVDKRYADKEKDSFEKLKEFFDNVEKRSVDDYDSSLQSEFTGDKLDGERPFQLKRTLEAISIDGAGSGSGSGLDNTTYESGDFWISGSGADPLVKVHHASSDKKIITPTVSEAQTNTDQTGDTSPIRISKREVQERFEGLPESLAVNDIHLARENPRVKILKNEAGNKVFDDIPLPFNKISEEQNTEVGYEENNIKENREATDSEGVAKLKATRSLPSKPIQYREFSSLDTFKHELGGDTLKNVRIIDEQKAKSLFDDDEGQFIKSVKKDGIYYDSRSKKILISAQIKSEKPFLNESASILQNDEIHRRTLKENLTDTSKHPALKENSTDASPNISENFNTTYVSLKENNISSNIKLPFLNERSINCTLLANNSCYNGDISNGVLSTKLNSSTVILPDIKKSDMVLTKRDIEEIFFSLFDPTPLSALKSNSKLVKVQKREILSDLDPNLAKKMGDTGKQLEDEFKVDTKRDVDKNANSFLGIWSGLGTEPEFVHGLIKQDFITEHGETELMDSVHAGAVKHKPKNKKSTTTKLNQYKKIQNDHKGKSKKFHSENNVAKGINFQKRDFIPSDDEEQEESKHMEMGSLGSLNMHVREKRGMAVTVKDDEDDEINLIKNQRLNEKSFYPLNDSLNHATKPSVHGKVVFAFDEVKELMPTRRFFTKQDPNLSPELLNIENSATQTRSDISYPPELGKSRKFKNTSPDIESQPTSAYLPPQKTFDLDRDLADSMVLGEKQHYLAAMPVKVELSSNRNPHPQERSSVYKEPKILNESLKSKQLHKVQLAQLKANEIKNKYRQLINWENSNPAEVPELEKDGIETEKELREFGKQFENTDIGKLQEAEIRALASPSAYHNAETSDIAYLAKQLQEKHYDAETPEHKARAFTQLQQKILNEQEQYKLLLQQQQKEYQDKVDNMAYYDSIYSNSEPYEVSPEVQPTDIQDASIITEDLSNPSKYPFSRLNKKPDTKPNKQFSKDSPYILSFKNADKIAEFNNTSQINRSINLLPESSQMQKNIKKGPDLVKPIENSNWKEVSQNEFNQREVSQKKLIQKDDLNKTFNSIDKKKSENLESNGNNSRNISNGFLVSQSIEQQTVSTDLNRTFSRVSNASVLQLNKTIPNILPILVISGQLVTKVFTTTPLPVVNVITTNSSILKSFPDKMLVNVSYFGNATELLTNVTANSEFNNISNVNGTISKLPIVFLNNTNLNLSSIKDTNKSYPVPLPFPIDISYQPKRSYKALEIEQRIDGYIGCYIDHLEEGRDLPVRAGVPFVTPNNCRSACKKTGYRYAGLQYGYLCFCGNSYGKYDIAPDTECDTICSGNETHTCGGLWRNKIYNTENVDEELNEGPVPVYITPREKYHLRAVQPGLRSNIPEKPFKSQVVTSDDFNNGMSHSILSSEEIIKTTQDAEKKDIANLQNISMLMKQKPVEHEGETLINFSYLHPQKETEEEFQNSPPMPLKIEPGTHLFRGEIILKQSWYSDLANPNSTKYLILTGNIEQALKNLFVKDPMFLKAEVMSLREISHRMPRKTLVDFTLTFEEHKKSQDVARILFTLVRKTERLDAMPVLPATLKIKEYLFEPSVQAYIPQIIEGNFTEDFSKEIQSNEIDKNLNSFETNYVSPILTLSEPTLSNAKLAHADVFNEEITRHPNSSFSEQVLNHLKISNSPNAFENVQTFPKTFETFQNLVNSHPFNPTYSHTENIKPENIVSVNRAVSTRIIPVKTSGVSELNNYLESQSKSVIPFPKMAIKSAPSIVKNAPSSKKVPYVLRMFFWKDMLARKKREDLDDLHREKVKKTIKFSSALPVRERRSENDEIKLFEGHNSNTPITPSKPKIKVIRDARSQADQWSTKYKRDIDKMRAHRENSLLLKRTKRVVPRNELQIMQNDKLEDKDDFSTLFREKHAIRARRHVVKKELISGDNFLKKTYDNFSNELEKELHRNKRSKDER